MAMITRGLEKLRRLGLVFCLLVGAGPLSAVSVAEPFFPIGIYGVGSKEHLQQVHEAGFNTVVGPANKAFLDQAQALGIQVIASPGASAGRISTHPNSKARSSTMITILRCTAGIWWMSLT